MNKKVSIILPIHKINDDYLVMFKNCIKSLDNFKDNVKLLIVTTKNIIDVLKDNLDESLDTIFIENNDKIDFVNQINLGINKCETEWFSILEIDDEFKPNWYEKTNKYINENQDVDVFLPIVKYQNTNGDFLTYVNESVWAYSFSETQGFIDNDLLLDFSTFQTSGGCYKTQTIKENGCFKDNIKLTFSYEFLLRLTQNGVKIMVIPYCEYIHTNMREDSLFWSYANGDDKINEEETKFWVNTAKKEFFFKNKRELSFTT